MDHMRYNKRQGNGERREMGDGRMEGKIHIASGKRENRERRV